MKIFFLGFVLISLYSSFIQADVVSKSIVKKAQSLQDKVELAWLKYYQKEYSIQDAAILASEYSKLRYTKLNDKRNVYFYTLKIKKAQTRLNESIAKLQSTKAGRKFLADKKKDKRHIDIKRYGKLLAEKAQLEKRITNTKIDIIIAKKFKEEESPKKNNNKKSKQGNRRGSRNRRGSGDRNRDENNRQSTKNKERLTTKTRWLESGLNPKEKNKKVQQLEKKLANLLALLKANQAEIDKVKLLLKKYIAQDEQINNATKKETTVKSEDEIPSSFEESEGEAF